MSQYEKPDLWKIKVCVTKLIKGAHRTLRQILNDLKDYKGRLSLRDNA